MSNNEIIDNLGAPEEKDPFRTEPIADATRQSAVRDRMVTVAALRSVSYDTLPLYIESFLLAIIANMYRDDPVFPYIAHDELATKIIISGAWQRGVVESRDLKPRIVVAFQQASADNMWLRNDAVTSQVNDPLPGGEKGVTENMTFRIVVMHHNRRLALFLAGQIRGKIMTVLDDIRSAFGLQKVYPPSMTGPGQMNEYDDLFGAFIDLRVMAIPRWRTERRPDYIRDIIVDTISIASEIFAGSITQDMKVGA